MIFLFELTWVWSKTKLYLEALLIIMPLAINGSINGNIITCGTGSVTDYADINWLVQFCFRADSHIKVWILKYWFLTLIEYDNNSEYNTDDESSNEEDLFNDSDTDDNEENNINDDNETKKSDNSDDDDDEDDDDVDDDIPIIPSIPIDLSKPEQLTKLQQQLLMDNGIAFEPPRLVPNKFGEEKSKKLKMISKMWQSFCVYVWWNLFYVCIYIIYIENKTLPLLWRRKNSVVLLNIV